MRRTPDRRRAEAFALGLDAAGIESRLESHDGEWWVVVALADQPRAARALDGFDEEVNQLAVVALPRRPEPPSLLGVTVALLLGAAYLVTGPVEPGSPWFERGAAISARLLHGESFRLVTALTLHAHFAHLLGNVAIGVLLLSAVGGALGGGVGSLVVLTTGVLGNLVAAIWAGPSHSSIGASTALFGALGLLSAPGTWRQGSRWSAWVGLAAGVALLGFIGTGPQADLYAHVGGFVIGLVVGAVVQRGPRLRGVRWLQGLAGGASLVVVAGSWWLAWR